jgi:tRNA (Thr-GGU) A37 N-methylase
MGYKFLHVGIPTTKVRPNEVYVEKMKLYKVDPQHSDYNVEYLRFQDGTPFPEIMHVNPHVAYEVDSIAEASKDTQVIVQPIDLGDVVICFVVKDNVIFELLERKK